MTTFKFHQDIKVSIWRRQHFSIEAESLEEAKAKAIKFQNEDVSNHNEFLYEELMYESEEHMLPDENGGQSTMQLYVKGADNPFATNADEGIKQQQCEYDEYKDAHQVAIGDMAGYNSECICHGGNNVFFAFHKNDKLVIVVLMQGKRAMRYSFDENWDELVNENQSFRETMADWMKKKYGKNLDKMSQIHDWLVGHLTEMKPMNNAVDNAVPFSLADIVSVWGSHAAVYEYHPARLVGYQIVGDNDEMPEGLFSFQVIRSREKALEWLAQVEKYEPHKTGMLVCPVYEGDIEGPSFI